jgi:hypothetical protein
MALSPVPKSRLLGLPIEILLDVYQHLDLDSIVELSLTNKFLLDFFQQRKTTILLPVLVQQFSPLDELLQVYTASAGDLDANRERYVPRKVVFKRWPGDSGQVLTPNATETINQPSGFTQVNKAGRVPGAADAPPQRTQTAVVLDERDLNGLLRHCRLVRKWEQLFPQMRFYYEPENCRTLRPHEAVRFRRALYRWWLYGIYFHGDLPRPRVGLPEPFVEDIRTSQMRRHSTGELLELMDLVETMKDVVLNYICPRLDPNHLQSFDELPLVDYDSREQSLAASWADQSRWGRVLKTYAKLGPRELMYYFENIYSYPRQRLIQEIHVQHPNFTFDQESIQLAIRCALDERKWLERTPSLAEESYGGIVDFDDERDGERLALASDANPDGALPAGMSFVRSFSQYSPRGDDGSYMEEHQRRSEYGATPVASAGWGTVYTR